MKYTKLFVFGFLLCVMFSGTATAQCYFVYSSNYAVYTSESYNGIDVFTSVLIDGSASMTIAGQYCGPGYQIMQNQINSATHTPSAYNAVGGTGGWGTGSSGCVNCYLSYQNNQSIAANPGQIYSWQTGGEIACSVGGVIFNTASIFDLEVATTWSIQDGTPYGCLLGVCSNPVGPWCDLAHSPPDFDPLVDVCVTSPIGYYVGSAVCVRLSSGFAWHCGPGVGQPLYSPQPLKACTKN